MPTPRLLFLSHHLPHPPDSGAAIRTANTLRILGQRYEVTALCLARPTESSGWGMKERVEALRPHGRVEAFPIPGASNAVRSLWDHLRSALTGQPWVRFLYESEGFRRRLGGILQQGEIDLVHVDSLDLVGYLPALGDLPTVCVHHNVESALLERMASAEGSRLRRAYIGYQARLLAAAEREWCPRMRLNVAVSARDRSSLEERVPDARFTVFPNGVDVERYRPEPGEEEGLVFVGGTTWFPNRDALHHFTEDILPRLHASGLRPPVRWVGSASAADVEAFGGADGVTLTGYVDDERPIMRNAACFVVPLRVGGGTRLKILNAWAMGLPVVSTRIGCEGLEARDGEHLLVADSPEEFADAVARVLRDPELRRRLGEAGRALAVSRYSWNVIGAAMGEAYDALLEEVRGP